MHHVAIMNTSWKLIPKILLGEKTIESRWYQTKRAPWDKAKAGDTIFFKNTGEPVSARARVTAVRQFELEGVEDVRRIIQKYGDDICLVNKNPKTWGKLPKYCILMRLERPTRIAKAFTINKKGFGSGVAWITVKNVRAIKKR